MIRPNLKVLHNYLQNVNEPAIIPLATAVGNRIYARRVKGNWRIPNMTGGMTSLSLRGISIVLLSPENVPTYP
jgi:hypothetical protein